MKLFNWITNKFKGGNFLGRIYRELLKLLPHLITAAGILIGITQFNAEQESNRSLEFRRKFWDKQLATYEETSDITASIINAIESSDSTRLYGAFDAYKKLYRGKLNLVQDSMVSVYSTYVLWQIQDYVGKDEFSDYYELENNLIKRSKQLTDEFKKSLSKEFDELK